jgi:hypothetical protein
MKRFAVCILVGASLAACTLQNLSPQARLQESVYTMNDTSRWNQLEAATRNVSPKYQSRFRARRKTWGETVNVAEIELVFMQLAPDKESATSEIALSWTDASGVNLHKSQLAQQWANEGGQFRLIDETIIKGDPRLFAEDAPAATQGP